MSKRVAKWLDVIAALLFALSVASSVGAQQASIEEAQQLNDQALKLHALGRYDEAIPLAQRALAIHEKVLGPEHSDTAMALNNLAYVYYATGAYAEAEPLYR